MLSVGVNCETLSHDLHPQRVYEQHFIRTKRDVGLQTKQSNTLKHIRFTLYCSGCVSFRVLHTLPCMYLSLHRWELSVRGLQGERDQEVCARGDRAD